MIRRNRQTTTPFLDLLFNCLVGFVFLFVVAFLMIAPEKKEAGIKTKAEFVITLTWDKANPDDVDLWLKNPLGQIMFFRRKEVNFMHLDRDDVGHANDNVYANGILIEYPYNQEIGTIRGAIPGEWIVNVHMYAKRSSTPANVTVRIDKINPKVTTIFLETFKLTEFEEVTVLRFRMTTDGSILLTSKEPYEMVKEELQHTGGNLSTGYIRR